MQPLSPLESHTEVVLDTVISEFTKLLIEYPSYYKEMPLPDTAQDVGPYCAGDIQEVDVV